MKTLGIVRNFSNCLNESGFPKIEEYRKCNVKTYVRMVSKQAVKIDFAQKYDIDDEDFSIFILKPKQAFYNNYDKVFPYVDYFMKYYDYDDELFMIYYRMKFMIDRKKHYSKELFLDELYEYIFSDTMIDKINQLVDDNYSIDLSAKKKYKFKSIQFLDEHGLIICQASIAIKIMLPLVTHYIYQAGLGNTDAFIYEAFKDVFDFFEDHNNMKNKIYEFTMSKIKKTQSKDKRHWNNVEIYGKDMESECDDIYSSMIVDIIYKCTFDGNIAAFFASSINQNINWMLKFKFNRNNKVITNERDADGLSEMDKIEMNMSKMDESYIIIGDINPDHVIKKLQRKYKINISKDELKYEIKHMSLNKLQKDLLFQAFAKYFGNVRDMHSVGRLRLAKLLIIFKKMMLMKGFTVIQYILTGKMHINPNLRKLSKKEIKTILDSDEYMFLEKKYRYVKNLILENKLLRETLNNIVNSDVQAIDYNLGETKKTINKQKYKVLIIYEFMKFVNDVI